MTDGLFKATKRPVTIEAMRFDGANGRAIVDWAAQHGVEVGFNGRVLGIPTLEGTALVSTPGSVVIRGVQGEFYPCAADIFEQTYDVVPECSKQVTVRKNGTLRHHTNGRPDGPGSRFTQRCDGSGTEVQG